MKKHSLILLAVISMAAASLTGCAAKPRLSDAPEYRRISKKDPAADFYIGQTWIGIASYYAEEHHGRKTASGAIFDMNKPSAAHRKLPFGTRIRVMNIKNKQAVELTVNDRGPWIKGRYLDVSKRAAQDLGMIRDGLVEVQITILSLPQR